MILEAGAKCTRVDFAFDWNIEATPFIDRVANSIREGDYTSRWRLQNAPSCLRIKAICDAGDTLYLGSKKSDCRLRLYDKAAEQKEDEPRLRIEFQVRKERANEYINFVTIDRESAVEYIKAFILGYFDIKKPVENDQNKTRWPTAQWWAEMWGQQKERLELGSEMPTEDQSRAWLERLGPSIAILLKLDKNADKDSNTILLAQLQNRLSRNIEQGLNTVLVIDEAHVIENHATIEELRMLLNMQSGDQFLITLILLGQPPLLKKVDELRSLKERITTRYHLDSLDFQNTVKYILFRLKKAGATRGIFTKEAIHSLYEYTGGLPLRINNLCDRSLLIGLIRKTRAIDSKIMIDAIEDIE